MSSANVEKSHATASRESAAFFRQSGWLMIANVGSGMFMWAVHFLAKAIPEEEYGGFGALLSVVMLLPTIPLQMVLAQQTARALAIQREQELSGLIRMFCWGIFGLWLLGSALVLLAQSWILHRWQLPNALGLWILLPILLLSLWLPIFAGVLQGNQNFLWLGWTMIFHGVGRLSIAAFAVLVIGAYSAGIMAGVLFGLLFAVAVAAWQTRSLWWQPAAPFDWRPLMRQVIPLMLGFFGFQVLFTADTLFVKAYFTGKETGFYLSAGTLSRALMWLVGPLATVMFPRLVQSAAKGKKTNLMSLVLIGTAVLAVVGAVSLSVLGPWIVRIVYKESFVAVASSILPWYASAMVPLAVANVLLNNLLARPRALPAFCVFALAIAYGIALTQFHDSLITVLKTLGIFNTLLLAICAWFTWTDRKSQPTNATSDQP